MPPAHHCETYTKHLTGVHGYPLWTPQLKAELPDDYQYEGLKIGDVGTLSPLDGSFDVLFNITLPCHRQPDPGLLREDFVPIRLDQGHIATDKDAFLAHDFVSSASVELASQYIDDCCDQTPSRANYEFVLRGTGAVLILPEGAQSCDLQNVRRFRDEAIRHAIGWHECATGAAGRLISNNTLYLITGFHKARSWSLGATGQNVSNYKTARPVKFKVGQIREGSITAGAYTWERTHGFHGRLGPLHPYEIGRGNPSDFPNQTVFVRGFRITVNNILFLKTVSIKTKQRTFFRFAGFRSRLSAGTSGSAPSSETEGGVDNTVEQDFSMNHSRFGMDKRVTIDHIPEVSQTFHPGDLINQYMLRKKPHAMIAVTHDSLWIEMLRMGLLEFADFSRERRLHKVLSKHYRMITEGDAVHLERGYASLTVETATPRHVDSPFSSRNNDSNKDGRPRPESTTLLPGAPNDTAQTSDTSSSHHESAGKEQAKEGTSVDSPPQVPPDPSNGSDAVSSAIPTPPLREWTRTKLAHDSWQDTLLSAAGMFAVSRFAIYRAVCECLDTTGRTMDASECFRQMVDELAEENVHDELTTWVIEFKRRCSGKLENLGDIATSSERYDDAISHYSAALSLDPAAPQGLFIKRSRAYLTKGLWEKALIDADEVIELDPLSPWGYERKGAALHKAGHYEDAVINAFEMILSRMSQSSDLDVHALRRQYANPGASRAIVRGAIRDAIRDSLRALIYTIPGQSLGKSKQAALFESQSLAEQDSIKSLAGEDPRNLSVWLLERFERFGDLADLQRAIAILDGLVKSTSMWDNRYCLALGNLGLALRCRFDRLGNLADLEDAISTQREAVNLSPDSHPNKPLYLNNLGSYYQTRFSRLGQLSDLEDAISTQREAVHLTPHGHPNKPVYLNNLGNSYQTRFERLGRLSDLEDAISTQREAVHLTPDGHPIKPVYLNNLGNSLQIRFSRLGQLNDLDDAISRNREAVYITPDDHPDKPACLSNLGNSLQTRFQRLGQFSDLEDAVSTQREAIHLTPDGHPNKPGYLNNLGNSLQTRFQRLGQLSDLEDAISTHREAVHLTPDGHPDKPGYLNSLGSSLQTRFQRLGQLGDLEDAISIQREAVHLTPHGHPDKPGRLNNLGNSLQTCFQRLGQLEDLEDAISTQREAVHLTPDGHPDKPGYLNSLGSSFQTRFQRLGQLGDLEDAISTQREAIHLTPDGHPHKPGHLNNLGSFLQTRFQRLGQINDLGDAISALKDAVHLIPGDHPQKLVVMNNLAKSFTTRFLHRGQVNDIERAISLSSHVASVPISPPSVRLSAAQYWIQCARLIHHPSLLHAYSVTVGLLPQLAWIGLSLEHRYDELTQSAGLVREAAAAALEAGFPETALEWLEHGRSIVWGDLFRLRSSYDELSSAHPDYARRLHALSTQLDQASAAHEQSLSSLSEQSPSGTRHTAESLRRVADKHRALAIERDKLLQEIRRLPGFERFLLRKSFSQLRAAAHSGPVVILNAAETRGDALIVVAGVDHVIHVPLPTFTLERSISLQKGFVREARVGGSGAQIDIGWKTILFPLWKYIVKPVLDALAFSVTPVDPSRIFWCPTGPLAFFPIHAAGCYDKQYSEPEKKVFDFVVSSYVPTLSTLLEPSDPNVDPPISPLRLLLVPQPPSDGQQKLPGVAVELQHIKDVVSSSPLACTTMEPSDGTVEEVLDLMKEADWVHFACHGVQDGVNSGFCLANEHRLKVRDIVVLSRPRGGLAFLSASQTAKGEQDLSDEPIHTAAGMLFAGYRGVIGTMGSISDVVAPDVAKDVYKELLGKGPRADYREAARALHKAVRNQRERGVGFDEWIPFIHVGL